MFNFVKENKWKAILSSLLIMSPAIVGAIMWDELPELMVTHFGINMKPDGYSSKAVAIFGLPLIFLAMHWICIIFTCFDKNNKNQNKKAMGIVFWILPIVSILMESVVFGAAMGKEFNMEFLMTVPIALLFIAFGNYMPKVTQNSTFGIKLPWTFASEENWNKTHRLGGKIWVACGFVILFSMLLPIKYMVAVLVTALVIAVVVPTVYSWQMYKKQVKSGIELSTKVRFSERGKKVVIAFTLLTLGFVGFLMFTGDIEVTFENDGFNIEASYWQDLYVEYDEIDSYELRESDTVGVRSNGYGSLRLSMGIFENDEFGRYTRYTYTGEDACIVLSDGENVLVLGGSSAEETKAIYEELVERIG